jgi:hypothetical protein
MRGLWQATGSGNRMSAHNAPQTGRPTIGDVVHYRHRVHGCLAAVVTSLPHEDGTSDLWQVPAERAGQPIAAGHLPGVPRAERESMCWHRPAHGCG